VQNETLGQRGRKSDALYRTRRLPVMTDEPSTTEHASDVAGFSLRAIPRARSLTPGTAKEAVRAIYRIGDPGLALGG
jgi:hypothetical protein